MWIASFTPPLEGPLSAAGPMNNPELVREVRSLQPVSRPLLGPVLQHRRSAACDRLSTFLTPYCWLRRNPSQSVGEL